MVPRPPQADCANCSASSRPSRSWTAPVGQNHLAQVLAAELGDKAVYVDLELPSDRAVVGAGALPGGSRHRLVILDEIHRTPGIFQVLRSVIDWRRRKGARAGQFRCSAPPRSTCSNSRRRASRAGLLI
jgi:hypothetical protein